LTGNTDKARQWFSEALAISQAASSTTLTLTALSGLAQTQIVQGKLRQAGETCRRGLEIPQVLGGLPVPAAAYVHLPLSDLLREQNELDQAEQHLAQGIRLCRQWQIYESLCDGYVYQARLMQAQGDMTGAMDTLRKAEALPGICQSVPRCGGPIAPCRVRLMLAQAASTGDPSTLEAVEQWAEAREIKTGETALPLGNELESLIWARLLTARGEHKAALDLLARLYETAETGGRTGRAIEILALQALAYQAGGDAGRACAAIERSLSLAEPEGYVRVYVDEGLPMAKLLTMVVDQRPATDQAAVAYANILLETFGPEATVDVEPSLMPEPSPTEPLLEPLTDRELDVLRLLRTELSGPEIAAELSVTVNSLPYTCGVTGEE